MNERIKELYGQAALVVFGYKVDVEGPNETLQKAINEKFAKLIVRECADIGERYADGNYEVYNQIMAHFGLEEPEE
jgi:hypothetical protein